MCLYQNNPSCDVQALSSLNNCLDFTTFQQSESVQRNFYFVELYNHCAFFSLWDFKTFQKCQRLVSILGHSTVWLGVPIPSFKVCQLVVGQKVMSCTRRSSCVHSYPHTLYRPAHWTLPPIGVKQSAVTCCRKTIPPVFFDPIVLYLV